MLHQATFAPSEWSPLPGGVPVATIAAVTFASAGHGGAYRAAPASQPGALFEHGHSRLQLVEHHSRVLEEGPRIR